MTRIGIDSSTIGHRQLSVEAIFDFAVDHGFDSIHFRDSTIISPTLDPARLVEIRDLARTRRLWLEVGLPSINPVRRSRVESRAVSAADHAVDLTRHVEALATLECKIARTILGERGDRLRTDTRWYAQLDACLDVIERLTSALRTHGVSLAIRDPRRYRLGRAPRFHRRPRQLPGRAGDQHRQPADDFWRTRSSPWKGSWLGFWSLRSRMPSWWQIRVVFPGRRGRWGRASCPCLTCWRSCSRPTPAQTFSIELSPGIVELPAFEPSWLEFFPSLSSASLAAVARLAIQCGTRYEEGSLERPEVIEATPWESRDLEWLASSLGYLRKIIAMLGAIQR